MLASLLLLTSSSVAAEAPTEFAAVQHQLLALPSDGVAAVDVALPLHDGSTSLFHMVDSRTLPARLRRRYPWLRSYQGHDTQGRTARIDIGAGHFRMSLRDGSGEYLVDQPVTGRPPHAGRPTLSLAPARTIRPPAATTTATAAGQLSASGMATPPLRYEFRLAVAASSRYAARFGGTREGALAAVAHAVNRANEVFETDLGVHFTLVDRNDRLMMTRPAQDPYLTRDPGPATVELIDRVIGPGNYDVGHALTTLFGGESRTGTSCSDDRSDDFFATHKAAAWSGHERPDAEPFAVGFMIHVLGRQLGAWPTANGCNRDTLADRAFEPGGGSTVMGFAASGCGGEAQWLQPVSDLYFHGANIGQVRGWLAGRGGRCATHVLHDGAAPWIDPQPLTEDEDVIPARTPFRLDATALPGPVARRLTYAWEQVDAGPEQRGALVDDGLGPLFRSFPPSASPERVFPRMDAVLGREPAGPGERLPATSRWLNFRLTVRDNAGASATTASEDKRVRVVDTGRPFAVLAPAASTVAQAGDVLRVRWDVAGTTEAPISCHFLELHLSLDGGDTWPHMLATDVRNNGEADVTLPAGVESTRARVRARCDWRPFFAVSPGDFTVRP